MLDKMWCGEGFAEKWVNLQAHDQETIFHNQSNPLWEAHSKTNSKRTDLKIPQFTFPYKESQKKTVEKREVFLS